MTKLIFFCVLLILTVNLINGQIRLSDANYRIYDAEGNPATLEQVVRAIEKTDVVFLGEQHDDAAAHALQMLIFRTVVEKYSKNRQVALSLEMFERDVQTVLNEYLQNLISETHFLASSRPWGNYKTDYRPLVELAKEKNLPVIAANAPRRYVNMVSRLGRDSLDKLSADAKKWLAPLPFGQSSDTYAQKFNALMGATSDSMTFLEHSPMLNAQTLWDATMAFSITEFLKSNKKSLIVHLNGSFHTENRLGTAEQLLKYRKNTKFLVVTMRYEDDFTKFDKTKHQDLGDFVILTDSKVPRSQR